MDIKNLNSSVSVSGQIGPEDVSFLADQGVKIIVCNRPDNEQSDQPTFNEIRKRAEQLNLRAFQIAFSGGQMHETHVNQFCELLKQGEKIHAYCRTGNRSNNLWQRSQELLANTSKADVNSNFGAPAIKRFDVVIVGAGSAGIACAASLLKRDNTLSVAIVDAAKHHYYQPGWTMVSGGVFSVESTVRKTEDLIPSKVKQWIPRAVAGFEPENNRVILDNDERLSYEHLVVAPGLKINWSGIEGLDESLGKNGVTSNYSYKTAPYTRQLVTSLNQGKALFTQPPMPIKCAGAPQKAMYLACSHWHKQHKINNIDTHFYNSGAVLFGVQAYVPALESYVQKYAIQTHFQHTLVKINGADKIATFKVVDSQGNEHFQESDFDMIHVTPPQQAPDFIQKSPLADDSGWLDVDQFTLQHTRYANIWGAGDVINAPNAKTMAAARKQVPVIAHNIIQTRKGAAINAHYDGYGSCPLTVEDGKIVMAEFGYGGKLLHTFPNWIINGTQPSRLAWYIKADFLPAFYWRGMLRGHEWLVKPNTAKP